MRLLKREPQTWYSYVIQFEIELLYSYVQSVEKQVKSSIERYNDEKETKVIEEYPEENDARIVDSYEGLDSETWHLPSIFLESFPNLQRRSALITLYVLIFQKRK